MIQVVRRSIVDVYNRYSFNRQSLAYDSKGRLYHLHNARFEQGKFGKGVLIEEGTTNLISNPTFRDGITGWLRQYNPDASYTILSEGNITYHQCKFINDSSSSAYIFRDITGLSPNTTYTLSFRGRWVFTQAVSNGVYVDLYEVGTFTFKERLFTSGGAVADSRPDWQRLSFQFTTGASETGVRIALVLYFGGNDETGSYFDVSECQLEQKPYATSFIDGTRAAETLTIPTAGVLNPQEGTVECWVYVNDIIKRQLGGSSNGMVISIPRLGGSPGIYLTHRGDSPVWEFRIYADDNTYTTKTVSNSYTPNGWHFFALRWSLDRADLFIDGVLRGTISNPKLPSGFYDIAYVGCWDSGYHINTLIDDLRISNRARTDEEIAAAYASGEPLPVDADTTYKLNFDGPDAQRAAKVLIV